MLTFREEVNADVRQTLWEIGALGDCTAEELSEGWKRPETKDEVLMEPVITPRNIFKSFTSIPTELKTLCLVDLCTWAALCTFLIYYTGELT